MLIDWMKFGPALVLLLTPIALFHGRRVRFRTIPSSFESYWSRTFALGLHTIDFGRALLGAWLLVEAISTDPELSTAMRFAEPAIQAGVLFVGMMLQTFVCKEIDGANPPFAYAMGVVLGFLPPLISGFAIFVAVVVAFGFRSAAVFFPILAFAVIGSGVLFAQFKLSLYSLLAIGGATMSPWLFTLLFPRHFVVAYAMKKTDHEPLSPEK